jgi:hypothetical protein
VTEIDEDELHLGRSGDALRPILLKNSIRKFGRKNLGHDEAIAAEFLSAMSSNTSLMVNRFLKIGTFFSAEPTGRVFQVRR